MFTRPAPSQFPPLLVCPCCEQSVEIVTIQRDLDNQKVCTVVYYHHNGEKHFVQYEPKSSGELTYGDSP
jgi:hypothetical protein